MCNQKKVKFILFSPIALIIFSLLIGACSNEPKEKEAHSEDVLAYLIDYDGKTGKLTFDEIEWIDHLNTERIKELGLDPESDFPSGFRIYNESKQTKSLKLSDEVNIDIVNGANLQEPLTIDAQELAKLIPKYGAPFHLVIKDNKIVKISEKYTP